MMIKNIFLKFNRFIWTAGQALTQRPHSRIDTVSDLFVWRSCDNWQTFFELYDIVSLFEDGLKIKYVNLIFFDSSGKKLLEENIQLLPSKRLTLNISNIIGNTFGEFGTFAVFHSSTPDCLIDNNSYIAERGYISYNFLRSPLNSYVHGNFDAISKGDGQELKLLGGSSCFPRKYFLQYELLPKFSYDIIFVNTSNAKKKFICSFIVNEGAISSEHYNFDIHPGGVYILRYNNYHNVSSRLIVKSRMIMSRPMVFHFDNNIIDVFHG